MEDLKRVLFQIMAKVKPKMLTHCSEMIVNYITIHCNTLHYTLEYTATHWSSGNKMRAGNKAGV